MNKLKTLVILLTVFSTIVVTKAAMSEEQMKMLKAILNDCAEKEKATQADIDDFLAGKPAIEPQAKCHRACLHENFGTMRDNKFYADGFFAMMNMKYKDDADKMQKAREVADICGNEGDADRCEAGAKICKCLGENLRARGL